MPQELLSTSAPSLTTSSRAAMPSARVEGGVAVDAAVEDLVAHDVGAGGHAADRADRQAAVDHVGDDVAGGGRGGVDAVRGAFGAGPGTGVAAAAETRVRRLRRVPRAEVGARGDDLAVVVVGQAFAVGAKAVGVGVAFAAEHGREVMDAAVHRGELDAGAGVGAAAQDVPHGRRVDEQRARVEVRVVRQVGVDGLDARQLGDLLAGGLAGGGA